MADYVVVIDLAVRAGAQADLERVFAGPFTTAIREQEGFRAVQLLRPADSLDYLLIITFADEALQQKWVATDLHNEVWSAMEASFSTYAVRPFHIV